MQEPGSEGFAVALSSTARSQDRGRYRFGWTGIVEGTRVFVGSSRGKNGPKRPIIGSFDCRPLNPCTQETTDAHE